MFSWGQGKFGQLGSGK
ncbi:MAG: hypothetical protein ACK521_00405 [bacterium]